MNNDIIYINESGYVKGLYVTDATIPIQVSPEIKEQTLTGRMFHAWKYKDGKITLELLPDYEVQYYRRQRDRQCFSFIDNRSPLWYNHLTEAQKQELDKWYQDWLDVTKTKVIPTKPEWLK